VKGRAKRGHDPGVVLAVTIDDVRAAAARIDGAVHRTPCPAGRTLSEITGVDVWLKYENVQHTSSFKERGARNFLASLDDARLRAGVVAASAGNHAQGVAHHARLLGVRATVVMPTTTPFAKITRTELEGATVVLDGHDFAGALARAQRIAADTGAVFVPAFDDPLIVAGQGTIGLELVEQVPDLDTVVVPVGGGGLIAGIAVAVKAVAPWVRVVGVQSETHPAFAVAVGGTNGPVPGNQEDQTTIAEGIAVKHPGALPLEIARPLVDRMLLVRDDTIERAIACYLEIEKTVVEGAGAASLAAVLEQPDEFAEQRCALVVSGGNIDLRMLSSVILRALARSGRLVRFRFEIPDLPGQLAQVAEIIGHAGGNIVDVEHHRDRLGVPLRETILEVSVETRDAQHADAITQRLRAAGLDAATG
jgi:threonine dehydratase